jgi:hypothetical protein
MDMGFPATSDVREFERHRPENKPDSTGVTNVHQRVLFMAQANGERDLNFYVWPVWTERRRSDAETQVTNESETRRLRIVSRMVRSAKGPVIEVTGAHGTGRGRAL